MPQIAAIGTKVYSLDYKNSYATRNGTSMATPGTSGTIVLLYERYKSIYNEKPLASLMKALVTNTAKDVGNPGPDYKYGYGNLNGLRAIKVLDNKMFYTANVANEVSHEREIVVPDGLVSLKIMLAYSDLATTPGTRSVLVNDLDIKVIKDGVTTLPWVLDGTNPSKNATLGIDNLNNTEQITIDNPVAGTYKIIVSGTKVTSDSQEFSVVYDYLAPELVLIYPIGGEKFNPGATEYIRWDYEGQPKTFLLEYSADGGTNYTTIANNVSADVRNFAWQVPSGPVANAKIRIIAGSYAGSSNEVFQIISEPKNLIIEKASCGVSSFKMSWDEIPGAKYEVLKLNGYKFDVVATITTPTYLFENLTVGENNWFSVRAIDIASGIVSERARAINVDPIFPLNLSASTLPILEDFNTKMAANYSLSKGAAGFIDYDYIDLDLLDGVKMAGSSVASASAWATSTSSDAFTKNPDYIKKISFCSIDAKSLSGKKIRMKFNLNWNSVGTANRNFFRVLVNGAIVKSDDGIEVYGGDVLAGKKIITYDLSNVAGSEFNVSLEAVIDNNFITVDNDDIYNDIFVDNFEIFEATKTDFALSSLITNAGFTNSETIKVAVRNYSPIALSNIPVSYKINDGTEVTEIIAGPLESLTELIYEFIQKADFSVQGSYTVESKVNYLGDEEASNNLIVKNVFSIGSDVLIGSTPASTCSATFTDSGTRYGDYADRLNQTTTFRPATDGNSIKVDFTAFDLEKGFDFLSVYNGTSTSTPLLGTYSGANLPPSFTSTATSGGLTFRFTSNNKTNGDGWIASITCVPKPTVDASIESIISLDILGKKTVDEKITINVKNFGQATLTNHPVFYQVNGGAKITDIVPTINPNATVSFTFATGADLSEVGATYIIRSGVDAPDDIATNDILEKTVYNRNELPIHTNANGYAISRLKWDDVEKTSGVSAYSDFKDVKIPVYAGITYQPEITITKAEAPLTRDLTAEVGVFSMIVIDLNGDGNLTDEFYARNFWINTQRFSGAPAIISTKTTHYFRNRATGIGGLTIPAGTTAGEKLMRVIHMYRSSNEFFNVNLGPTFNEVESSSDDFEIEEYTINVLPITPANAGIDKIVAPIKPGKLPVVVRATIRNYSNVAIKDFPIAYRINGGVEVVETVTTSIAVGGTADYIFVAKADLSTPADYIIDVYTKLAGDTDPSNDSKSISLSHAANYVTNVVGTFDGVDDFIKTDSTPALSITNNYTFEAWINQKKSGVSFSRILDKSKVLVFIHNDSSLSTYNENSLALSISADSGSYFINTSQNSIQQNKWHHIAFSVSSENVYTIYIDGVAVPFTIRGTVATASSNVTFPAYIGNNADLTRGFAGNIEEIRIWSGVRNQATISDNMMTKYVGNEPNLLAYYSFSEGDKPFVFDYSPNDNTAVVTNADASGIGEGKFWNIPILLKEVEFPNFPSMYDASTKTFSVMLSDGGDIKNILANFVTEMNSTIKINGVAQATGVSSNDYSNPVTLTVEGIGFNADISETYKIKVLEGLRNESKLITYNYKTDSNSNLSEEISSVINESNATATAPYGTNTSDLIASFEISPGAELFIDETKQENFKTETLDYSASRVVYVISENKISKTHYVVTVNVAKNNKADFITYSVPNQVGVSDVDSTMKTIKIWVNNNVTLNSLTPIFEVSEKANVTLDSNNQESGVTSLNYIGTFQYTVTAQDGTIVNWIVTIERVKPTITLLGDAIVNQEKGCSYVEPGYIAKDNLDADITSNVTISGTVDVNTAGQYILTYTGKDSFNNETSITRTINVSNVICTLGVDTNEKDAFTIYPNPVNNGKVSIITSSNTVKSINIFDISGKKVMRFKTEKEELNLSGLQQGIYIIRVEQDGKISSQKLIIE